MQIVLLAVSSVICAVLYRAGGMSRDASAEPKWIPVCMRRSWVRDWIIPVVMYVPVLISPCHAMMIILAIGLTGAALTTYWDEVFGYDNFWAHGFVIGLAAYPLIVCGADPWRLFIRALALGLLVGGWSALIKKDWLEEMGRGFLVAVSVGILL
jgi:hypothetical protein